LSSQTFHEWLRVDDVLNKDGSGVITNRTGEILEKERTTQCSDMHCELTNIVKMLRGL
jgi:hypothetical protein